MKAPPKSWTREEERFLRHWYQEERLEVLAEALERSPAAVQSRAKVLKLGISRRWQPHELEFVRSHYRSKTCAEIAEALNRDSASCSGVYQAARKLGLRKAPPHWPDEVLDVVRTLHAKGMTDMIIAETRPDLFKSGQPGRGQVRHIRERLKLPTNLDTEYAKERRRRGVQNQLRTLGLTSPTQLRSRAYRLFAEKYNLPGDLQPVQVKILLALLSGPKTRIELREAIGVHAGFKFHSNTPGHSADNSYTARLVQRGLIFSTTIPGRGGRSSGPKWRYALTMAAVELLSQAGGGQCLSSNATR